MHQVTERRRLATGQPLYEQTYRQIIGEANVGHLFLTAAAADQDVVVAVDADNLASWIVDQGLKGSERGMDAGITGSSERTLGLDAPAIVVLP